MNAKDYQELQGQLFLPRKVTVQEINKREGTLILGKSKIKRDKDKEYIVHIYLMHGRIHIYMNMR